MANKSTPPFGLFCFSKASLKLRFAHPSENKKAQMLRGPACSIPQRNGITNVIPLGGCGKQINAALRAFLFFQGFAEAALRSPCSKQKPSAVAEGVDLFAEEEGFEPPDRVNGLRFSRPVQ